MINFRYHLASLVAVFLALAVGVVMGSTVIDRAIVDGLRDRINTVEAKADHTKAENGQLRSDIDRVKGYVDASAPFAVENRLTGVPLQVFAVRGAGDDAVKATVTALQQAGAEVGDFLWVEPSWALSDEASRSKLAVAADIPVASPRAMRAAAWKAVASELAATNAVPAVPGPAPPAAATTVATGDDGVIARLTAAGFLTREQVNTTANVAVPGRAVRTLFVTTSNSQVEAPDLLGAQTRATVAEDLATTAAEFFVDSDDGPDRGEALAPIFAAPTLARAVSTVDDLEVTEGRVATAIALQQLAAGTVGHYGYGAGATQSFPVVAPT